MRAEDNVFLLAISTIPLNTNHVSVRYMGFYYIYMDNYLREVC